MDKNINDKTLVLTNQEKARFLQRLSKRVVKTLYLIEEETETGHSPTEFIQGQIYELRAINELVELELTDAIVKMHGLLDYKNEEFSTVRKQIFEIKSIVDYLAKKYSKKI